MIKNSYSLIINIIILSLLKGNVIAQDKIITSRQDTILCKIQRLDKEYIVYNFPDSIDTQEHSIARFKTIEIFYANKLIETNPKKKSKYIIFKQPDWRIDAGLGYSYFLELPFDDFGPDYANFFKPLRHGNSFYAEISKFPDIRFGGGLEFQFANFQHSQENVIVYDTSLIFLDQGKVTENIRIFYFQPKGYYAVFSSTWDFVAGGGINFAFLDRKIDVINERYRYSGESIGFGLSAAIDRKLSSNISIGIRSSIGLVLLSSIRINGEPVELDEDNYFSASQFSLSFGAKYLF